MDKDTEVEITDDIVIETETEDTETPVAEVADFEELEEEDDDDEEESDAETPFATRIDIDAETRVEAIVLLNQHLADMSDLYSQTKQAHWNVRGIHFQQLHELFDMLAATLPPFIDEIAERAGALGGYARGTVQMAADTSRLEEFPGDVSAGQDMLELMADRWSQYAAAVRDAIDEADELDDDATEDLFTEIQRSVDKSLWFIEAHLQ